MTRTPALAALSLLAVAVAVTGARAGSPRQAAPIVFVSATSGTASPELAVRSVSGRITRLTRDGYHQGLPAWSPDRRRIAFIDARSGSADVYVANADGSGLRRLARGSRRGSDELYPAWSPDGRLIAFSSYRQGSGHVYVMRADGGGLRRVTATPPGVDNHQPRFTPDGRHLIVSSNRGGSSHELYRIRVADGGGARRLTTGGGLNADVSPDGRRIAFVSARGGHGAVWVARADGAGARLVAAHPGLEVAYPRFSPDGLTLLYSTLRAGDTVDAFRLRTVRLDGTGRTVLGPGAEADW